MHYNCYSILKLHLTNEELLLFLDHDVNNFFFLSNLRVFKELDKI